MEQGEGGAGKRLEENADALRYLYQLYQGQYSALVNEMNRSLEYIRELNDAQKTLESMGSVAGRGSLVHAGASVYIEARIGDGGKVLVGIGGGFMAEKSLEEAKGFISGRIGRTTSVFNGLAKSRKDLGRAIMEISYRIEALGR